MDVIKLHSGTASASILPRRGALISELTLTDAGSVLWMPETFEVNSNDWPGGGLPFLFPFAGRVQQAGRMYFYKLADKIFPMPLHGFSWSSAWDVLDVQSESARLQLKTNSESRQLYPFDFLIVMDVTLKATCLLIDVEIKNLNSKSHHDQHKMPVAVGWHPYFNLIDSPTKLKMDAKKIYPVTKDGMAGSPIDAIDYLGEGPWSLPKTELQSLILGSLSERRADLLRSSNSIRVECAPPDLFNYFVTWSNEPKQFICVEPWMSQPNAIVSPTGCRWLAAGEGLKAHLTISRR